VVVRRVTADEWRALRDVRLRALEEAPSAFATRFEEARTRPDEWWVDWTARSATDHDQAMFLAWVDDEPVGIAGTFVDDGTRWLISMWTTPALRGRGVGRALVDAVVAFARGAGTTEVLLEVTDGNEGARALYRGCGFVDAGPGEGHDDGTATWLMRLAL
jgi:GNAT superfamily N-acetyltransferase